VARELAAIRSKYASVRHISFRAPWSPSRIITRFTRDGGYSGWVELNEEYGGNVTRTFPWADTVILDFEGILHPKRLAERYSELRGVIAGASTCSVPDGPYFYREVAHSSDGPNVYPKFVGKNITYLFRDVRDVGDSEWMPAHESPQQQTVRRKRNGTLESLLHLDSKLYYQGLVKFEEYWYFTFEGGTPTLIGHWIPSDVPPVWEDPKYSPDPPAWWEDPKYSPDPPAWWEEAKQNQDLYRDEGKEPQGCWKFSSYKREYFRPVNLSEKWCTPQKFLYNRKVTTYLGRRVS
jgi:hypothetical protein